METPRNPRLRKRFASPVAQKADFENQLKEIEGFLTKTNLSATYRAWGEKLVKDLKTEITKLS